MRNPTMNRVVVTVALMGAAVGCDKKAMDVVVNPQAVPGTLELVLTVGGKVGGALIELHGPDIGILRPVSDGMGVFQIETEDAVLLAIVGTRLEGPLLTFDVPDVTLRGVYEARLVEVADVQNVVMRDLLGLALRVRLAGDDKPPAVMFSEDGQLAR